MKTDDAHAKGTSHFINDICINKYTVLEEMKATWGELKQRVASENAEASFWSWQTDLSTVSLISLGPSNSISKDTYYII